MDPVIAVKPKDFGGTTGQVAGTADNMHGDGQMPEVVVGSNPLTEGPTPVKS